MRSSHFLFLFFFAVIFSLNAQAEFGLRCKKYPIDAVQMVGDGCKSQTGLCTSGQMGKYRTLFEVNEIVAGPGGTTGYSGTWSATHKNSNKGTIVFTVNGILDSSNGNDVSMSGGTIQATGKMAKVSKAYFGDSMYATTALPGFHGAAHFCVPANSADVDINAD